MKKTALRGLITFGGIIAHIDNYSKKMYDVCMKKLYIVFMCLVIVSVPLVFYSVHSNADSSNQWQYIPSTQLEYAGETCAPNAPLDTINTIYTYPDGVHSVANPPDPNVVNAFKNGQAQIATVVTKMQAAESIMAEHHADNTDPYQSTLNSYIRQYNNLLSQYDNCN